MYWCLIEKKNFKEWFRKSVVHFCETSLGLYDAGSFLEPSLYDAGSFLELGLHDVVLMLNRQRNFKEQLFRKFVLFYG
jgi:hypothetical protein